MSYEDRDVDKPQVDESTTREPDAMRPIPDGGLQQAIPEWLRRPPAWRNLPKREDPAVAAVETASTPVRELPEPDTGTIDPRTLVDVLDLPQWLQDMAARESAAVPAPPVPTTAPNAEEPKMTHHEKRLESEPQEERVVAFEPVDKKKWEVPEHETKVYGGGKPTGPNLPMVLLIGGLIIVVLAVILFIVL